MLIPVRTKIAAGHTVNILANSGVLDIIQHVNFMDTPARKPMSKIRHALLWTALALIIFLIFMSIYGAFIGAGRAQVFFNRLPLAVYWIAFVLVLIIGIAAFPRLVHSRELLLIHVGCVLVLLGGMWGSQAGHTLQKRLFKIDKIRSGLMVIEEDHNDNQVLLGADRTEDLPFEIKLKDFRLEFYEPEYLIIRSRDGQSWRIPFELGKEIPLGGEIGSVKVLRKFENFRITMDGNNRNITDSPQTGYNPAIEIRMTQPDGTITMKYAFEKFPGHGHPQENFTFGYQRIVREYISELQVIKDGKVVAEKNIEVNHPLHYGGYHFYQQDYDHENLRYTVLKVVSDTGVPLVYAGYWMLCFGVIWLMWLSNIVKNKRTKKLNKWKRNILLRV